MQADSRTQCLQLLFAGTCCVHGKLVLCPTGARALDAHSGGLGSENFAKVYMHTAEPHVLRQE